MLRRCENNYYLLYILYEDRNYIHYKNVLSISVYDAININTNTMADNNKY